MAAKPLRLYLEKGVNENSHIYVDTICLPQHQYDGIRFLYRQYKKGKVGVILNDPPGYGKRVQTILFLNAVHPIMALPTLILCTEGFEEVWIEQFCKWTNMGSDISVQKGNEFTNSKCVIGSISHINVLCRREWGIAVIDDNNVSKEVLRAWVCAKYRIWLTSYDMKKHLQSFALIYKWYYPKNKFLADDFQADKKPTALLSNSVKLDAFLEDIVIRRRDVTVPLGQTCYKPDRFQGTRKNKDITGKKIKRSKCLPDKDMNTSGESQETGSENMSLESATNGEFKDRESAEDFVFNIENKRAVKTDKDKQDTSTRNNEVTNYSAFKTKDDHGVQEKSDNIEFNPDTRDENFLLKSEIHSQNFILKFDSETQDAKIENDIPAKKSKVTNEINISEDLFSTNTILTEKVIK